MRDDKDVKKYLLALTRGFRPRWFLRIPKRPASICALLATASIRNVEYRLNIRHPDQFLILKIFKNVAQCLSAINNWCQKKVAGDFPNVRSANRCIAAVSIL
ncbi:MAG TPA: hypothetical protein VEU75_02940 [Candidatus Acidoferrum sp.]|nr:hypothetical protein [Candidatus Acidoferrum sp.]